MNHINAERVQASLLKCSQALKFDLALLPLFISTEKGGSPAYVTPDGIWIHQKVVDKDPDNVHVYVAHEVFHWVVNNYSILHKFTHMQVNFITDFKINELLYKLFGFNVHKVKYKGLLNKKWFGLSLDEIGKRLISEDIVEEKTCSAEGMPHPMIAECASNLRRRYKQHLEASVEIFMFTTDEDKVFTRAFQSVDRSQMKFTMLPIDKFMMLKSLWYCFWHAQPFASRPDGALPTEHQLLFSVRWPQALPTVGRDVDAMWAAVRMLAILDSDREFLRTKINHTQARINLVGGKLLVARKRKVRLKLAATLARLQTKYKAWVAARPLAEMLIAEPIRLKTAMEVSSRPRTMISSQKETTDVLLPPVRVSAPVKRIRQIVRPRMGQILETLDSMDALQEALGALFTNEQYPEDENLKTPVEEGVEAATSPEKESNDGEESTQNAPSDKEDVPSTEDASGDSAAEEMDSDDGSSVETNPDKSKESDSALKDAEGNSGEAQDGESDATAQTDEADSTSLDSKSKSDKHKGSERLAMMEAMQLRTDQIMRILSHMQEAETLINQMTKRRSKVGDEGPDATYDYGNSLLNMAPEEVAFLIGKNTKLNFLVKYATHQLLQRVPLDHKRHPLVLLLDQSGSMFGAFYERAAGFCLAILKYMMKERRGVSLITFDCGIGREVHADVGQKVDILAIVKILTSPTYGGTNFQTAFRRAQQTRDHFKWKSCSTLCITDGYDRISNPQEILDNKKPNDKLIGVVVSNNSGDALAPVCDEIQHLEKRDMMHLVQAARSLF